ncbi:MAG: cupin domain-containing protein [Kordiimonas sp.]
MLLKEAQEILSHTLAPLSYDQFFNDFIGQKPLALLGNNLNQRHLLLGNDPKKLILEAYEKYAPALRCHIHTPTAPPPTAKAVPNAKAFHELIGEYHKNDYTVRIPEVDSISPELSLFTRALEVIFRKPAGAILFWSQDKAKAPIHYDHQDVIVIQLAGKKRWHISNEQALIPNKWRRIGDKPQNLGQYSTYDVELGDLIYFPRGTSHTVESIGESIHVAIEFVPTSIRDAINSVLDNLSNFNRPLRLGAGSRADDIANGKGIDVIIQQIQDGLSELQSNCQSKAFVQQALDHTYARMIKDLPKLDPPKTPPQISATTKVKHKASAIAQIMTTEDTLDFTQPGDQFLIHRGVEESMHFIINMPEFRVSEIPGGIGDDIRIALTSRLLMTGFLELAE